MVDTRWSGKDGLDGVVEVGRFAFGVAGIAYGADDTAMGYHAQGVGTNFMQVGVIMQSPFGAEDHNEVAAKPVLACADDEAGGSGVNIGAFLCEDIDSFVGDGFSPGEDPKGMLVIAVAGGAFDGHDEVLGQQVAGDQDGDEDEGYRNEWEAAFFGGLHRQSR